MEDGISTLSENDIEQAQAEMSDFLRSEIERIDHELSHPDNPEITISRGRIDEILLELDKMSTVKISQPEFIIRRIGNNGFDLKWRDEQTQQRAA